MPGILFYIPNAVPGNDENTMLLLHMDDVSISDSSTAGHNTTLYANAARSATQSKFGGYSLKLDGTDDNMDVDDHAVWDFGTNDFTIDWWEYRESTTFLKSSCARSALVAKPAFLAGVNNPGGTDLEFFATTNGSIWDIANAKDMGSISLNTWVHFAIVRNGTTWYLFKNGVQTDTWVHAGSLNTEANPISIGIYNNGFWFQGYIDEFRISNVARWTGNFTPPVKAYS